MTSSKHRGFTLIELIIFIVVVSAGLAGILSVINMTIKSSADPMVRKQAMALADSILEEILQKEYQDPDGTTGESTRETMDDVDDYYGKTTTLFSDWPAMLSNYTVVIDVAPPAPFGGVAAKKIRVTVTGGADSITMTGYRTNY